MKRSEILNNEWMGGSCHIHALACNAAHGGRFAVVYDHSDPYGFDEDGEDIPSVWHVWSIHETPEGLIARDATGDVPLNDLKERAILIWDDLEYRFNDGEAHIDTDVCMEELLQLIDAKDSGDRPLHEVRQEHITEASEMRSVRDLPGTIEPVQIDPETPSP